MSQPPTEQPSSNHNPPNADGDELTPAVRHRFINLLRTSSRGWLDRFFLPLLLLIQILFTSVHVLASDWLVVGVSVLGIALLMATALMRPLQRFLLGESFQRYHAVYLGILWLCGVMLVAAARQMAQYPATGKGSEDFYIFGVLLLAVLWRAALSFFALAPLTRRLFIKDINLFELLVRILSEFVAASLLALVLGTQIAYVLQPNVFTVQTNVPYTLLLLISLGGYYLMAQGMWLKRWNRWLSNPRVWTFIMRFVAPLALVTATLVIGRHFAYLSDARTVDLLGTANINQMILVVSPIVWSMVLFLVILAWTSNEGLRERFLPDMLLAHLPNFVSQQLKRLSDVELMLFIMLLAMPIPIQTLFFDSGANAIETLRLQLAQQNALIDSSDQALAFIFGLPFYVLAVAVLVLYGYVLLKRGITAQARNQLVTELPISILIIFIIVLYLCAIPFSQVITEGRLPQLPQELGRVLAFDILIPLLLLYIHFFILIRIPYSRGQSRWRTRRDDELLQAQRGIEQRIQQLDTAIVTYQRRWNDSLNVSPDERLSLLYQFINLNSERDQLNMRLLNIVDEQQKLKTVSESPGALLIARLPVYIVSWGIPIVLGVKIYEWAIVNDGLREIANNPNIGVFEFFQIILEQTQF